MVSGGDVGGAPRSLTGDGERGVSRNMTCSLTGAEDGERGGTGDGEWVLQRTRLLPPQTWLRLPSTTTIIFHGLIIIIIIYVRICTGSKLHVKKIKE